MKHRRKVCKGCGVEKSLQGFYRKKSYADGHMNSCKVCARKAIDERYELKRDMILAQRRRRWREDPEYRQRAAAAIQRWRQTERGKAAIAESRKAWQVTHPEQAERTQREHWRKTAERRKQLRAEARA